MKKTYQAPETCIITMMHETTILAGSPQVEPKYKRRIGYEVSDLYSNPAANALNGKTIPFEVYEVSTFEGDPFGGHGQGNNGEGTRAGGFSLWED